MQKEERFEVGFSVNLRYLLWRNGIARESWVSELVGWLDSSPVRAAGLLTGAIPKQAEIDVLASRLGVTSEDLRFTDFIAELGHDVLVENLRYLVEGAEHGEKARIAKALGVHATSLSRWLAGIHRPDKRYRIMLASHFGLQSEIELGGTPLFLSLRPVSEKDQKRWLWLAIDNLDQRVLNDLFPALYKLLS